MAKNAARHVKSGFEALKATVERLTESAVLVGVPAEKAGRKDDGEMNNATLLYIHDNGSPAANIPARKTLQPGVEAVSGDIAEGLGAAAKKALQTNKESQADKDLHRVGLMAVSSVKKQFDDLSPPLKPSTILNRWRGRKTKSMRKSEKEYAEMVKGGAAPNAAANFGIKPLVNTGQLRNAINYVIRKVR